MTEEPFAAHVEGQPDARFTEWLRERSEPNWTKATEHRFTEELVDGRLDEAPLRRYLIQDFAFVGTLVSVVGYAVGQAPTMDAKRMLTGFLATLTDEENDYFERAFDALDVPPAERASPDRTDVTEAFDDLLVRAALEGGYEETLAVLVPAEWVYLTWASSATSTPEAFYHREWIELHANPAFESFVTWLRRELDQYGQDLDERRQRRVERLFRRTVGLEVAFFDSAYQEDDQSRSVT